MSQTVAANRNTAAVGARDSEVSERTSGEVCSEKVHYRSFIDLKINNNNVGRGVFTEQTWHGLVRRGAERTEAENIVDKVKVFHSRVRF